MKTAVRIASFPRNRTEEAFAQYLAGLEKRGEVLWWEYEPVKLRLAKSTFYSPDFLVLAADGQLVAYEIKGYWRDDARVKIKVAARSFPFLRFIAVKKGKAGWEFEEIGV